MTQADRPTRDAFPVLDPVTTRWHDNDVYGHMNNVVYYALFDTAVNRWLVEKAGLVVPGGPVIGLVAETGCRYFASVGFPEALAVGLAAERVGRTSITYRLAVFGAAPEAAAVCRYVHVYVDAATRRPVPLPETLRRAAEALVV
jgi:acyl-CoA thioester hydrolase